MLPFAHRCILLALPALLLAACAPAHERQDCQTLLSRHRYDAVLRDCDSPYERASARLGLAGFNIFDVLTLNAGSPLVVQALQLTPANIDAKRSAVNAAVNEVRRPQTSAEAYAALLAGLLGLNTTVSEYLDNGASGVDTPLDDTITSAEVQEATGMTTNPAPAFSAAQSTSPGIPPFIPPFIPPGIPPAVGHYAVVVGGVPYIVVCNDIVVPFCDVTDGLGTVTVYDDPDGSGLYNPLSPPPLAVPIPNLATATQANLVLQLTNLVLPIGLDPVKTPIMEGFLGQGDPAGKFDIGVLGYLDVMQAADRRIIQESGGGTVKTPISGFVASARARLDNGATCIDTIDPSTVMRTFLDTLAPIQTSAAGTAANPVPVPLGTPAPAGFYTNLNAPPGLDLSGLGLELVLLNPALFVWSGLPRMGYKFLYPKVQGSGLSYDAANATPRVDEADLSFITNLNALPQLAPSLAGEGDGHVTFIELLCVTY